MRLKKLILEQFRNYERLELDFDVSEPMTYIVGPNAQGKTNILESIYLLALTKSFRTTKQQDMIGWSHEYARVKGYFEEEKGDAATITDSINNTVSGRPDQEHSLAAPPVDPPEGRGPARSWELETFLGKPPQPQKVFKKNVVKMSAANFIGNCQVVFFHPEDLNMLYLGPDLRRAYLNVMNVQVNRKYFSALRSYQKVLKQRNALLHAISKGEAPLYGETSTTPYDNDITSPNFSSQHPMSQLNVWDDQLVECGSYLMEERASTISYFQKHLSSTYQKISQGDEQVQINYRHTLTTEPTSSEEWKFQFAKDLAAARSRDLRALVTTVGPHRDDLELSFHRLKLASHASRGEYRSLLLALKLIELNFFEDKSGQRPILLLDDVFSELDPKRQNLLLEAIQGHQTIITTTHLNAPIDRAHRNLKQSMGENLMRSGKYLEVSRGTIHEPQNDHEKASLEK